MHAVMCAVKCTLSHGLTTHSQEQEFFYDLGTPLAGILIGMLIFQKFFLESRI